MQETRKARLASVIREELSMVVRGLKDPRIPLLTFTNVEVADDGSHAIVYLLILGGNKHEGQMKECLDGLKSASGFLRRHLAKILTIRHIPTLQFKEDKGLDNANRVYELLKQIDKKDATTAATSDEESAKK